MIAYPVGTANTLKSYKDSLRQNGTTLDNANKAFEELDKKPSVDKPRADAVPINQLNLVEVENEEYKKRRADALQKPGAVYGRTTISSM